MNIFIVDFQKLGTQSIKFAFPRHSPSPFAKAATCSRWLHLLKA